MYLFLIYLYRSFIHFKGEMGNVLIHKKYLSKSMIGYVAYIIATFSLSLEDLLLNGMVLTCGALKNLLWSKGWRGGGKFQKKL